MSVKSIVAYAYKREGESSPLKYYFSTGDDEGVLLQGLSDVLKEGGTREELLKKEIIFLSIELHDVCECCGADIITKSFIEYI